MVDGWMRKIIRRKYSAVIKLARLMVVQYGYEQRQAAIRSLMDDGMDLKQAEEEAGSHYRLVHRMMERFMTLSTGERDPTPMDWMLDSRTYGLKIRYTS